jgi:hypothetical protein
MSRKSFLVSPEEIFSLALQSSRSVSAVNSEATSRSTPAPRYGPLPPPVYWRRPGTHESHSPYIATTTLPTTKKIQSRPQRRACAKHVNYPTSNSESGWSPDLNEFATGVEMESQSSARKSFFFREGVPCKLLDLATLKRLTSVVLPPPSPAKFRSPTINAIWFTDLCCQLPSSRPSTLNVFLRDHPSSVWLNTGGV